MRLVRRHSSWDLEVDGAVEKTKLDEFLTTNAALLKACDDDPMQAVESAGRTPKRVARWDDLRQGYPPTRGAISSGNIKQKGVV